jgi:glycosyltransferase involved in cell wall biosynthesis
LRWNRLADVSIVIPTLDRTTLLARTLVRVLSQSDVDLEVLVIDDGSTPAAATTPNLRPLLADARIRVVRHDQTKGVAAARNTGIAAATAPWLAFLDDDDLWASNKLATQLGALADRPDCTWSYTGDVTLDEDPSVLWITEGPAGQGIDVRLLQKNAVPGGASSVVAATTAVKEAGGFDESFSVLADWDLWIRLSQLGCAAAVRDPLVGYVKHRQGMSFDTRRSLAEFGRLEEKYRSVRQSRNVEIDALSYLRYISDLECRAGRRWSAAAHRFQIGMPRMGPRSVARTMATLVSPTAFYRKQERRMRRICDPAMLDSAQRWLDDMSDSSDTADRHSLSTHEASDNQ